MKKILLIIILLVCLGEIMPQDAQGGSISFTINNERIVLPLFTVMLRKENAITITARAEKNTEDITNMVSIEFMLKELGKDAQIPDGLRCDIMSSNKKDSSGVDLSLKYPEYCRYNIKKGGQRTSYELVAFSMHFNIEDVFYKNKKLVITGKFDVKLRDSNSKEKDYTLAEVKDGAFRIEI